jgi:tetratricopeptide (TPR) repeat protein
VYVRQVMVRQVRGDLAGVEQHFARGLQFLEDPALPNARITAFATASGNAWLLGRADLARERLARLMAEANHDNPTAGAWSKSLGGLIYWLLGERERAEMLLAQALELFEKHQLAMFAEDARGKLGWCRAALGRPSEGVTLIRQGIAGLAAIGMHKDDFTVYLAFAQALSGAINDALETIEQVLPPKRPANLYWPTAFRLRGDLRRNQGRREAAEADFREALTLARDMGAKMLELQATMSLARLLRDTSRRDEARAILAEIYNWFTEGFDTPDLKEAKSLLEELGDTQR